MTRLLVTGGAGYVGAHTVRHLLAAGIAPADIVVFDSLERGHSAFVPAGVELMQGDLRSPEEVERLFSEHRFDSILHFAAYTYVGESVSDPALYFDNNVVGGLNLLEAARRHGCRNIVLSSTCAVYGTPASLPITEDCALAPASPYGMSKRTLEDMLESYARSYAIRSVCLRYFNAAGAAYGIGELHEPETHLVPLVLRTALGHQPHVTINGSDYATPDGTCVRDYVHVVDLAEAHGRALEVLRAGTTGHARLNLGSGTGTSVREIVEVSRQITGAEIPVVIGPRREGDPAALYAEATRARRLLGWTPHRGLREMIEDAWRWHRGAGV